MRYVGFAYVSCLFMRPLTLKITKTFQKSALELLSFVVLGLQMNFFCSAENTCQGIVFKTVVGHGILSRHVSSNHPNAPQYLLAKLPNLLASYPSLDSAF